MIDTITGRILSFILKQVAAVLPPPKSLRLLLNLDNKLYQVISKAAIDYDSGLHPKHRLISYHDYFFAELKAAGLMVESYEVRWGEIWAKALPVK